MSEHSPQQPVQELSDQQLEDRFRELFAQLHPEDQADLRAVMTRLNREQGGEA